jgi:hypothetical protein
MIPETLRGCHNRAAGETRKYFWFQMADFSGGLV